MDVSNVSDPLSAALALSGLSIGNDKANHKITAATGVAVRPARKQKSGKKHRQENKRNASRKQRGHEPGDANNDGSNAPKGRWSNGLDWPIVLWISALHVGALAGIYFFTWKA